MRESARSALIGPLLQSFFVEHLYAHKRVSSRTVESYRDTFRLLLQYIQDTTRKEPCSLCVSDLDAPVILTFLAHLEQQRHNQAQSRNVRLAAIRSFFRVVALRDPASLGIATRVLAIPTKRTDKKLIGYLTRTEMEAVLAAPDLSQWSGRRDHALLLTLYNTGARVSEVISLQRHQVRFGNKSFVQFTGKECHSYCISLRPRHETTGTHTCRQAYDPAFSVADVRLVARTGIGLGPYTDGHGAGRFEPMSEPYPA